MAHSEQEERDDQEGDGFVNIEDLIDLRLRERLSLSTTQMGLFRIEESFHPNCPDTLLPWLYQAIPFSGDLEEKEVQFYMN